MPLNVAQPEGEVVVRDAVGLALRPVRIFGDRGQPFDEPQLCETRQQSRRLDAQPVMDLVVLRATGGDGLEGDPAQPADVSLSGEQ